MWHRREVLKVAGASLLSSLGAQLALAAPPKEEVNIVNASASIIPVLIEMMKTRGYMEQLGLAGEWTSVSDGSKIIAALVTGSSDVCPASGFSGIFPAIEKGAKLKIIANARPTPETAVYSAKAEIRSVKDLVDRTIGVGAPGALLHQEMVALLSKNGIDQKQVSFVNIGSNADVFRAVMAGRVDAGPASSQYYENQRSYGVHSLIGGEMWQLYT